jgi:hypothetical protein
MDMLLMRILDVGDIMQDLFLIVILVYFYLFYNLLFIGPQLLLLSRKINSNIIPKISFAISLPLTLLSSINPMLEDTITFLNFMMLYLFIFNVPTFITNHIYIKYCKGSNEENE